MSLSFNNVGINITSDKLQLVEIRGEGENFKVENIEEEFFGEVLDFNDKEAKIINILQNAFDEITLRTEIKSANFSFSLPPNRFIVFEIPFEPSLSRSDFKRHIKWEFEQLFPHEDSNAYTLSEIKIENSNLRTVPTLIILAIKNSHVRALHKFCLRNKLNLKFVDHAHLSAANILRGIKKKETAVTYSLYISDKSFSIVILDANQRPIYFNNYSFESVVQVIDILKNAMKVIEQLGIPSPAENTGYISGDNITDTLLTQIQEESNLTCFKLNPFSIIKVKHELEESKLHTLKYNSFTAAVGIALRLG